MTDPEDQMREADWGRVEKALDVLSEHFDAVQIFASRCESGELNGTIRVERGSGNWFARYGQIRSWVIRMDEQEREAQRQDDKDGE